MTVGAKRKIIEQISNMSDSIARNENVTSLFKPGNPDVCAAPIKAGTSTEDKDPSAKILRKVLGIRIAVKKISETSPTLKNRIKKISRMNAMQRLMSAKKPIFELCIRMERDIQNP